MISLNISSKEDDAVELLAAQDGRTKTEIIREAIREYVNRRMELIQNITPVKPREEA